MRVRWLPLVTLAGASALAVVSDTGLPAAPTPVSLAVAGLTACWLLIGTLRADRPPVVFFPGLLVLSAVLVWCDTVFGFFAWSGYLYVLTALRGRWRLAGAAGVGTVVAVSQVGGFRLIAQHPSTMLLPLVLVWALNVGIGTGMTFLTISDDEHAARREQLLTELSAANAKLAAAMTENAGLHAQLLTQAREAGVLDERQRLAGEIHDTLAQGLTGIVTQLEAADQAAGRPDDWRRHLETAKQLARDSLGEARRSVRALSPQPLAGAALPAALAETVDGWSQVSGVPAELITTGTARPLLPEIDATLLRTAQEALANVAKHAGATRVALTLSYMEDLVTLDVRDDGAGFDPAASLPQGYQGGFGLPAMRDRVLRISGSLEVESEPGGGTAISACVPAIPLRAAA